MKYGIFIALSLAVVGGVYWLGVAPSGAEIAEEEDSSVSVSEVTFEQKENSGNEDQEATEEVSDEMVYKNETYDFSLTYPKDAKLSDYTDEMIMIKKGKTDALADVAVITDEFTTADDIDALIYTEARLRCDADGVEGSVKCGEVKEKEEFVSESGIEGERFVLEKIISTADGEKSYESYGPIFAFPINKLPTGATIGAVLIAPSLSGGDEEIELVETIADSFKL